MDDSEPVIIGHLAQGLIASDAGVVDENIQTPPSGAYLLHHVDPGRALTDISLQKERLRAALAQLFRQLLRFARAGAEVEGNRGPLGGEQRRDGASDTARCAGDERILAAQFPHEMTPSIYLVPRMPRTLTLRDLFT